MEEENRVGPTQMSHIPPPREGEVYSMCGVAAHHHEWHWESDEFNLSLFRGPPVRQISEQPAGCSTIFLWVGAVQENIQSSSWRCEEDSRRAFRTGLHAQVGRQHKQLSQNWCALSAHAALLSLRWLIRASRRCHEIMSDIFSWFSQLWAAETLGIPSVHCVLIWLWVDLQFWMISLFQNWMFYFW